MKFVKKHLWWIIGAGAVYFFFIKGGSKGAM
jgi:hypothetical protein